MAPLMEKFLTFMVLVCAVAAGSVAVAEDAPAQPAPERMTVVYVGEGKISVKPGNGKDKSVKSTKYKVNDETKITINGEPGELSSIKPGHKVVIVPREDDAEIAASITLTKSGGK